MQTYVTAPQTERNTRPPLTPAYRVRKLREIVSRLRLRVAAGENVDLGWLAALEAGVAALAGEVRR